MSVEQTLTRQRILLRETSQYLKRDFRKYIFNALGMWVWIFNLNLNKGDKYRSTYYFFRNIDDVLDGDRDVEENPLDYANSIKMAIEKEVFDFNRYPILQTAQTSLEYLERVKKPGDQPKELMIQLIDAIISDHLRIKHRKVLSQAELLEEYRKQFYPMHNLQLICVGSNVGFQEDVDYFPIFQARVQSLSDLQNDWSKHLFNIPKEVLEKAQIDAQSTTYEELILSPVVRRWIYEEAVDCLERLGDTKKILSRKLRGSQEKYSRIIYRGLIIGLEHSLGRILR